MDFTNELRRSIDQNRDAPVASGPPASFGSIFTATYETLNQTEGFAAQRDTALSVMQKTMRNNVGHGVDPLDEGTLSALSFMVEGQVPIPDLNDKDAPVLAADAVRKLSVFNMQRQAAGLPEMTLDAVRTQLPGEAADVRGAQRRLSEQSPGFTAGLAEVAGEAASAMNFNANPVNVAASLFAAPYAATGAARVFITEGVIGAGAEAATLGLTADNYEALKVEVNPGRRIASAALASGVFGVGLYGIGRGGAYVAERIVPRKLSAAEGPDIDATLDAVPDTSLAQAQAALAPETVPATGTQQAMADMTPAEGRVIYQALFNHQNEGKGFTLSPDDYDVLVQMSVPLGMSPDELIEDMARFSVAERVEMGKEEFVKLLETRGDVDAAQLANAIRAVEGGEPPATHRAAVYMDLLNADTPPWFAPDARGDIAGTATQHASRDELLSTSALDALTFAPFIPQTTRTTPDVISRGIRDNVVASANARKARYTTQLRDVQNQRGQAQAAQEQLDIETALLPALRTDVDTAARATHAKARAVEVEQREIKTRWAELESRIQQAEAELITTRRAVTDTPTRASKRAINTAEKQVTKLRAERRALSAEYRTNQVEAQQRFHEAQQASTAANVAHRADMADLTIVDRELLMRKRDNAARIADLEAAEAGLNARVEEADTTIREQTAATPVTDITPSMQRYADVTRAQQQAWAGLPDRIKELIDPLGVRSTTTRAPSAAFAEAETRVTTALDGAEDILETRIPRQKIDPEAATVDGEFPTVQRFDIEGVDEALRSTPVFADDLGDVPLTRALDDIYEDERILSAMEICKL